MLSTDLKTGVIFKEDGAPFLVERYEHTKTARGGATIKVKVRNLLTDQVLEKRYQSGARVEDADVMRKNAQYLFFDGAYNFMDPDTYDQFIMTADRVGDSSKFLLDGSTVQILYFEGNPVSLELPNSLVFEITETTPGYKGNTVSSVYKDATLNNGTVVKVPTFIKEGDKVKIDTRSGEYVSKA